MNWKDFFLERFQSILNKEIIVFNEIKPANLELIHDGKLLINEKGDIRAGKGALLEPSIDLLCRKIIANQWDYAILIDLFNADEPYLIKDPIFKSFWIEEIRFKYALRNDIKNSENFEIFISNNLSYEYILALGDFSSSVQSESQFKINVLNQINFKFLAVNIIFPVYDEEGFAILSRGA